MVEKIQNPYLVGGFEPTPLKNMRKSNWVLIFPKFRGENTKYLSCNHLVMTFHGFYWLVSRDPYMGFITIPDITG